MKSCTRCRRALPDVYALVRIDDPWDDWDVRAELCKPCVDAVRACLEGTGPTEPAPAPAGTGGRVSTGANVVQFRANWSGPGIMRKHGRCTCRNNPSWPHCSLCQDVLRCDGCNFCDLDFVTDVANETAKGKPHCLRVDCEVCNGGDYCGRELKR
jgi:hypothetical protein